MLFTRPPTVGGQCHRRRDDMIKIKFTDEGGMQLQFPQTKGKAQERCMERLNRIMAEQDTFNPSLAVVLGIAAMNGTKTFDKALRYFNVA